MAFRLDKSRSAGPGSLLLLCATLLVAVSSVTALNFTLPPLPYPTGALEPIIDNQTMIFHHDTHHLAYINNLNAALVSQRHLSNWTLTQIVRQIGTGGLHVPADIETTIRNQAGGAWNHAFFWRIMAQPNSTNTTLPSNSSDLGGDIVRHFGSFDNLIAKVNQVAAARFGSGWAWLVYKPHHHGKLEVVDTANQDVPLSGSNDDYRVPLLCIDVWEHAYYLKHGPKRATYLSNWWKVANWRQVEANYMTARSSSHNYAALIGAADVRR